MTGSKYSKYSKYSGEYFFFCINIYFSKRRLPKSYQAHRGAYVKKLATLEKMATLEQWGQIKAALESPAGCERVGNYDSDYT